MTNSECAVHSCCKQNELNWLSWLHVSLCLDTKWPLSGVRGIRKCANQINIKHQTLITNISLSTAPQSSSILAIWPSEHEVDQPDRSWPESGTNESTRQIINFSIGQSTGCNSPAGWIQKGNNSLHSSLLPTSHTHTHTHTHTHCHICVRIRPVPSCICVCVSST